MIKATPSRRESDTAMAVLQSQFETHVEKTEEHIRFDREMFAKLTLAVEGLTEWKNEMHGSVRVLLWVCGMSPIVASGIWAFVLMMIKEKL